MTPLFSRWYCDCSLRLFPFIPPQVNRKRCHAAALQDAGATADFRMATTTTSTDTGSMIDPQSLMAIKSLEMRARVVVEGFWSGIHRSPYHGFSVEFTEYRAYSPGDDLRYLDWKLLARSDRLYIKKFEDETNLRCFLLSDGSRSMTFGSVGYSKAEYANTLAATLAYFLNQQGDAVGLMTFDERIRDYVPARHRHGHLRQVMHALEKPAGGEGTDVSTPLKRAAELVRKRGLMVLISDMLAPLDTLEKDLALLAASGHEVLLFQLFDPAEINFGFEKSAQFIDLESGQDIFIDPVQARREYVEGFDAHNDAVELACQKNGIGYHRLLTDRPLELTLFDFLRERMRRGRTVQRNTFKAA